MSFSGTKGYLTKPKPGVMLNPLHPLSRGLVGYWLFNEMAGSIVNDISGNNNHGQLTNMTPNTQGSGWGGSKFGGGLQFDGVNDYVNTNHAPTYSTSQDFSISFRLKTTESVGIGSWVGYVATIAEKGATDPAIIIGQSDSLGLDTEMDKITVYVRDLNGVVINWSSGLATISDGEYHHINLVRSTKDDKFYLYVDSIIDMTKTDTSTANIDLSGFPYYIGAANSRGTGSNCADVDIDFIYFHDRALSANETKLLYLDPFCNLLQVPIRRYSVAAPPVGAIMNQFQRANMGADLYNGVFA